MKNNTDSNHQISNLLGYVLAILWVLVAVLAILAIIIHWDWFDQSAGSGVTAIATVVIALFTAFLFFETRRLRTDQSRPYLDIYIEPSAIGPQGYEEYWIHLVNNGLGGAKNIKVEVSDYIDPDRNDSEKETDLERFFNTYMPAKYKSISIISNGVPMLGSKSSRKYILNIKDISDQWYSTQTTDNFSPVQLKYTARVKIKYQDISGKKNHDSYGVLDFSSTKEY